VSTPTTVDIVDDLAAIVGGSPSVSRVQPLTADHDELALLVEVRDDAAADLWSVLDLLMAAEFGAILPGWRDPADGVERVYLVPWRGSLLRVRLHLGATQPLLDLLSGEPTATEYVAEGLVLLHRMADHVRAGRFLACHADLERVRRAVCGLVGLTVAAGAESQGWYGLDDALEATPLGRRCLILLRDLLSTPAPESRTELAAVVDRVLDIVALVGRPAGVELAGPVDSFRRYLRII